MFPLLVQQIILRLHVTCVLFMFFGCSIWIMHHVPSFLELKAKHLRKNFAGEVDLDHDMISLMMRCFKQADDAAMSILFWSAENITWRPIWW